jgi:hypothetical protein
MKPSETIVGKTYSMTSPYISEGWPSVKVIAKTKFGVRVESACSPSEPFLVEYGFAGLPCNDFTELEAPKAARKERMPKAEYFAMRAEQARAAGLLNKAAYYEGRLLKMGV